MPRLHRDLATWLIYLQLGLWGYFNYGFGPVMPLLRDEQHTSAAAASLHSTAIAVGAVLGGALYPVLSRRYGRGAVLWGGQGVIALGVLGFVTLPARYPVTLALTALIAVAGIAMIGGIVAALSDRHGPAGPAAISEANAVCCAAGLLAPLAVGATMRAGLGWRTGFGLLVGLIVLLALVAYLRRISVAGGPAVAPAADTAPRRPLPRAYWLAWSMMTLTGAVEVVLSMWAASVLRDRAGMSPGVATAVMSAVVAGMFIGRLGGARIALRVRSIPLYLCALAVSLAGFALFWSATGPVVAVAGLAVLGLGNAMHYPLAIGLALGAAAGQADRAAGVASYSMAVSFGAGPLALGLVADQVGPHTAFLLIPLLLTAAATLALRLTPPTPAPAPAPLPGWGAGSVFAGEGYAVGEGE
ncbi:MFS transporter [Catellatospora sp. KI3]|uniref:MFS transporter n=1 Tax=Catellatospora sp. KI3 TaxID=3041620 RepID=UPI002482B0A9|nr:MFS transporter [Catellatospora sp. KI3]MDI1459925.1 MFS transporter [Catellatospora sp. KI3]